jgi:hypothetical protein
MDWAEIRKNRLSKERPDEWPDGVYGISMSGAGLLGVHEKTNKLYWDGKEIVTRNIVRLGTVELWFAGIATASTFGIFVLGVGRVAGWWN